MKADSLPKGGAKSSVFPVPPRPVIELTDWDQALALAKRIPPRKSITKQLFALMPRIREVDAHADDERLHEIHPEVSFRRLADLHPEITDASLLMAKKTWRGQQHRRALLAAAGKQTPDRDQSQVGRRARRLLVRARKPLRGSSVEAPEQLM